jgi:hypothetical protein
MSPPHSCSKSKPSKKSAMLHGGFLLDLFFDPEGGGDMFIRNVGYITTVTFPLYFLIFCVAIII